MKLSIPSTILTAFVVLFVIASLQACSMVGGKDIRFYSLLSLAEAPENATIPSDVKIGIGPIYLPKALKRPQLVVRKSPTELTLAESHQWVGSLREDVIRVVGENFARQLNTSELENFPWKQSFKPDYQIRVNIERMDGQLGGQVRLKARWRLFKNNKMIHVADANISVPTKGKDYNAYVYAQSEALLKLTQQIVGTL